MIGYKDVTSIFQNAFNQGGTTGKILGDVYTPISVIIKIALILVLMYIAIKVGNSVIEHSIERQKKLKFSLDERKSKTLGTLLKSLLKYSVYLFGVIGIINEIFGILFGRGLGLAFGSVIGVSVGFGAQNLIKDVINGIFILFEDQFAVGDYIDIEGKSGIVESVEIRITKLRDFNGDMHIIPNGLITKVTNHSRGNSRILVDVDICYEENVDRAIKVIDDVCEKFKKDNENVVEGPKVLGVSDLKEKGFTIRVIGRVKPMTQWDNEAKLRKQIKEGLEEGKIEIPYPRIRIVNQK